MIGMLSLYRRHVKACGFTKRTETKCNCPVWCDGTIGGERVNESLDTRNWGTAGRKMGELEAGLTAGRVAMPAGSGLAAYIASRKLEPTTKVKYDRWAKFIAAFCAEQGIEAVDQIGLAHLDAYRATRGVNELTWSKELQFLRGFFKFAGKRGWLADKDESPAHDMDMPRDPKPGERVPYTPDEVAAILRACDTFGKGSYERRRARALVLLGRNYGFRISDATMLERARVNGGQIFIRAKKNGEMLWAHVYPEVQAALDALPVPRHAGPDCPYFFWAGPESSTPENIVKTTERTMLAVFRRSGVKQAHFHRFRHTLATELLTANAGIEDVANILGDDPATVRKYYLKWSPAYQARTAALLDAVHSKKPATPARHEENSTANDVFSDDYVVAKVGVELPDRTGTEQLTENTSRRKGAKCQ